MVTRDSFTDVKDVEKIGWDQPNEGTKKNVVILTIPISKFWVTSNRSSKHTCSIKFAVFILPVV